MSWSLSGHRERGPHTVRMACQMMDGSRAYGTAVMSEAARNHAGIAEITG